MRTTIVGGGNIGTQYAVHCAECGHEVTIYTNKPDKFNRKLSIVDENNQTIHTGEIKLATSDPATAFTKAELIFVTVPAFLMNDAAETILKYIDTETKIGLIPGTGGGECAFRSHIEYGGTVFGMQRVPSVARLVEYGKTVRAVGYREKLSVASLPSQQAESCAEIIANIFKMPCDIVADYLALTLTPSNPILHTTRLYRLFRDFRPGDGYQKLPLFYEDWDDETSRLTLVCDDEVQNICKKLPEFNLSSVKSLREHYESETVNDLTKKIRSIAGFKGIQTPSVHVKTGEVAPDLQSRYFTADFPYGLSILQQIAHLANVETPNINKIYAWYKKLNQPHGREFCFADYKINNLTDLKSFYKK